MHKHKRLLLMVISITAVIACIIGITFAIVWGSFGRQPKNKIGIIMDYAYLSSPFNYNFQAVI